MNAQRFFTLMIMGLTLASCNFVSPTTTSSAQGFQTTGAYVQLGWQSNLGEQDGFLIEQSTDGTNFKQILTVTDGTNSANVTGLQPSTKYYFRIRGYNAAGDSAYSQVVTATTPL